jgi:hypothetical protein
MQHRIQERLGIEVASWLVDAVLPPPGAAVERSAIEAPEGNQSALERLRTQITRLQAARAVPGLSDRARVDLERVELGASRELARLEGRDVTMNQILGSLHWRRLEGVMVTALEPWPDAMRAISAALKASGL